MASLLLRRARCLEGPALTAPRDVLVRDGAVAPAEEATAEIAEIDLGGRALLPALVNAHEVLDLSTLPPLGAHAPYASVYEWTRDSEAEMAGLAPALAVPLVDRLFLGGIRNLLAGVASVLHHHPDHRSLARPDFPVRVQHRYGFAHSPGRTRGLRRTYRTSDRRIPWIVRAAEGNDGALRNELDVLAAARVLRQNTVIARGTALEAEDAARLVAARASLAWCPESDLLLYGRTPPAAALRAAGVALGLGTDGAAAGARDLLSTLVVARGQGGFSDRALLELATRGSGAVARMPVGGFQPGDPGDFVVAATPEALLEGDRHAVALVVVRGQAVYGEPALLVPGARGVTPIEVDGALRALDARLARRLASLVRRGPAAPRARWLVGLAL